MPELIFDSWTQYLMIAGVLVLAEAVYVSFGFGAGLISVGSLALILPEVRDVVVMLLLVNIPVELAVVAQSRRVIAWRGVGLVAVGLVVGTPVGTRILKAGEPALVLLGLGGFLVLAGVAFLALPPSFRVRWQPWTAPVAGAGSGLLSGLFGTGGPPLVLYYHLAGAAKEEFRGNLMAIFALQTCLRFPNYLLEGLITPPRVASSLAVLPAVALGALLGRRVHLELSEVAFRRLVSVLLALIGLALLVRG